MSLPCLELMRRPSPLTPALSPEGRGGLGDARGHRRLIAEFYPARMESLALKSPNRRAWYLAPSPLWGEGWGEGRRRLMLSLFLTETARRLPPSPLWGEGWGEGLRRLMLTLFLATAAS